MKRLAVWLSLGAALACNGGEQGQLSPSGFLGAELPNPVPKPDFTFTDSKGKPFSLVTETEGKVTLLFFGYTHCPDVCPVHLANIAAVLDKLSEEETRDIRVVFVTTDPERDSIAVLDRWVKGFNPAFIGLTGSDSLLAAAQGIVKLLPAIRDSVRDASGGYAVGHAATVIAYTRDGMGRVMYPFGTRQRDWAHDLPLLLAYGAK
ncbi:MAG: SCO family protein [Gemmatimonadota bacterium]